MAERIAFTIDGEPQGKERPRGHARIIWQGGVPKAVVTFHTPKETVQAEKAVLQAFRAAHPRHVPFAGPVLLKFVAIFAIPTSWPAKLQEAARRGTLFCMKKPDKDNIEKLIVDALSPPKRRPGDQVAPTPAGYAWVDDQQVMGGGLKRYGHPPRVEVWIEALTGPGDMATPGEKRFQARVEARDDVPALPPPRRIPPNAGKRQHPPALQSRIDAALARDERERRR